MTLTEIAQTCADAIVREKFHADDCDVSKAARDPRGIEAACTCHYRDYKPQVIFTIPREPSRRAANIRLAGPGSPTGHIMNVQERIESPSGWITVASFSAEDVIRWLLRNGVKIECQVRPEAAK